MSSTSLPIHRSPFTHGQRCPQSWQVTCGDQYLNVSFERPGLPACCQIVPSAGFDPCSPLRTAVHGRPHFAKRSVHEGLQEQIAPVHSDFSCGRGRCP
jgi:hypothetical protein